MQSYITGHRACTRAFRLLFRDSSLEKTPKTQINAACITRQGLLLVSGRYPALGRHPPVDGTAGAPLQDVTIGQQRQRPSGVAHVVRCEQQLAARSKHASEGRDCLRPDKPAPVMLSLWPGIGEQDEQPIDAGGLETVEQHAGVVRENAHAFEAQPMRASQQRGDTVHVRFAADTADLGMGQRLPDQMLAGAEADLQPDLSRRAWKKQPRIELLTVGRQRQTQIGQSLGQQIALRRAQRAAKLSAVGPWPARRRRPQRLGHPAANSLRKPSTRLVTSQEKPPSGSGARPKWP